MSHSGGDSVALGIGPVSLFSHLLGSRSPPVPLQSGTGGDRDPRRWRGGGERERETRPTGDNLRAGNEQPQLVSLGDGLCGVVLAFIQRHQRAVLRPHQPLVQRPDVNKANDDVISMQYSAPTSRLYSDLTSTMCTLTSSAYRTPPPPASCIAT